MRIGKRGFEARVKGSLSIEFGAEKLTSHAGLELIRQFLRRVGVMDALRASERRLAVGGDFSLGKVVLAIVAMLLVGAKRLRHLTFLGNDPLFLRFVGLSRSPTERSLGRALTRMGAEAWSELERCSHLVVRRGVEKLGLGRWTLDIDGSVLTTGLRVERAARGYNPHHRKNPSYYPILATLAQTGHVVGHRNRRGNVHDSHQSDEFLRKTVRTLRNLSTSVRHAGRRTNRSRLATYRLEGFTHICAKTRSGTFLFARRTIRQRMRNRSTAPHPLLRSRLVSTKTATPLVARYWQMPAPSMIRICQGCLQARLVGQTLVCEGSQSCWQLRLPGEPRHTRFAPQ